MNPYKMVYVKGKYHPEHRLIMEKYLGRKLERWEHVHHINENKLDNRIENLVVMTIQEHVEHHHRIYPRYYVCPVCGRKFERLSTKHGYVVTCSKKCMGDWFKKNSTSRKKINQYTSDGKFIKQWDSARDASRSLKICDTGICQCCKGKIKTFHGFIWKHVE